MTGAAGSGTGGCIFCEAAADSGRDEDQLVLVRRAQAYVILNRYPYNNGHLMVVTNRHVATLHASTPDELSELMQLVRHAEIALTEAYTPQGINVGINLGRPAGAGDRRSSARPPRAAMDGRHQLHLGGRPGPRAARGAGADGVTGCGRSSSGSPATTFNARGRKATQSRIKPSGVNLCVHGVLCVDRLMILELTPEQAAFKESVEEFARDVVAPRAAAIDEIGRLPGRRDARRR